jgi:hypothetical protein
MQEGKIRIGISSWLWLEQAKLANNSVASDD